jgi:hypothetical protein
VPSDFLGIKDSGNFFFSPMRRYVLETIRDSPLVFYLLMFLEYFREEKLKSVQVLEMLSIQNFDFKNQGFRFVIYSPSLILIFTIEHIYHFYRKYRML